MVKVYSIDFEQAISEYRDEFPKQFVALMERAKPKYHFGLLTDQFLQHGGHLTQIIPEFNLRPGETIDELFGRLCEDVYKPEIMNTGWSFSDKAVELIKCAPHGYIEYIGD